MGTHKECGLTRPFFSLEESSFHGLSDRQMGKLAKLAESRAKIDQSLLSRKHKVWYYQHSLYQWVMWPLKVCVIPASEVCKMESLANSYIRKWMGLPCCFSDTGLFGHAGAPLETHQPRI